MKHKVEVLAVILVATGTAVVANWPHEFFLAIPDSYEIKSRLLPLDMAGNFIADNKPQSGRKRTEGTRDSAT